VAIGLAVGQSIKSKSEEWYKCIQHLGTGGNAVTFLVIATSGVNNGSLFALKIFQRVTDHDRLQKFYAEIDFLEQCDHPSIMRVYDSGEYLAKGNSHPFVVMEYLPTHLHAVMRRDELDVTAKASLATQLASALAYLNGLEPKIIHRDIKPQNIFIKGKTCVLGDFGLMKVCSEENQDEEADRNDMKSYIGMPFYYRTPDLVAYTKGESELTTASDVFQLGLVLTELFTKRNPCVTPNDKLDPVKMERIGNIPGELGGLIFKTIIPMLEMEPKDRPSTKDLLDHWNGVFEVAVEKAHALNGKAL
jgi:serine/threonine protein kinase